MSSGGRAEVAEYRLFLNVDFDAGRWIGRIEFDRTDPRDALELDAVGLEISGVRVGGHEAGVDYRRDTGKLRVPAAEDGAASVSVEFAGEVIPGTLTGFYRCRHADGTALTTQCEPVGARRIFPCLDEPNRKARVRLTVQTRPDLEVISNTTPDRTREVGGVREWSFAATPPMSTYLFYLGIARFDRAEDRDGRVGIRVLSPPGRGAAGAYGALAGRRVLEGFEEYFRIPYPLPKLDLIAFEDHAFGAMENWGAISFRDSRLLVDATADSYTQRDVFETVAHEIAHQWFGNLVTMESWDDIWLNESFASLMETRLSERLIPEMDPLTDFYLRSAGASAAFDGDSLPSTHPVRAHVPRPELMSQIFDEISYGKGSSILAMLESYLGPEAFRAGVVDYLEKFRYSNARTEDLWDALGRAAQVPVAEIATPWVDRPGHPVIFARREGATLRLRQRRYSFLPTEEDEAPWPIPLVVDIDGKRTRVSFDSREVEVPVPADSTVHLNPGAVGFYRVHYDQDLSDHLLAALPARSATDRWSVMNDLGAFLLSGDTDWTTYVRFARALGRSTDLLLEDAIGGTLQVVARVLPEVPAVHDEVRRYFAEQVAALGVRRRPIEPPGLGVLRERLCSARVRVDLAFAHELAELFPEWSRLDPDLRPAVAVARARTEGEVGWNELRRALGHAGTEAERLLLTRALPWTDDPALLAATLDMTTSGEIIRGHTFYALTNAALNPAGREVLWPWLQRHLPEIDAGLRGSIFFANLLYRMTPWVALGREEEVRSYFRDHPYPEGSRGLAKGLERLEIYERLRARSATFVT